MAGWVALWLAGWMEGTVSDCYHGCSHLADLLLCSPSCLPSTTGTCHSFIPVCRSVHCFWLDVVGEIAKMEREGAFQIDLLAVIPSRCS